MSSVFALTVTVVLLWVCFCGAESDSATALTSSAYAALGQSCTREEDLGARSIFLKRCAPDAECYLPPRPLLDTAGSSKLLVGRCRSRCPRGHVALADAVGGDSSNSWRDQFGNCIPVACRLWHDGCGDCEPRACRFHTACPNPDPARVGCRDAPASHVLPQFCTGGCTRACATLLPRCVLQPEHWRSNPCM